MVTLDLVAPGLFSSNKDVFRADGSLLARLEFSSWKEKGSITGGGRCYTVRKDGMWSNHFTLQEEGRVVCHATMKSFWSRTVALHYEGVNYSLKWAGWGRRVKIFREGLEFGSVYGRGFFEQKIRAELREELATPLETFMLWLVILGWDRDSGAVVSV